MVTIICAGSEWPDSEMVTTNARTSNPLKLMISITSVLDSCSKYISNLKHWKPVLLSLHD